MTFQKNIFQCWIQGESNMTNKNYIENAKNWKLLNPDWNHRVIDDDFIKKACSVFSQECLDTYNSFDIMHLKIDFGRYVVLYLYGGMYCDMDMYVLRGLDNSDIISNFLKTYNEKTHILGLSSIVIDWYEKLLFKTNDFVLNNAVMISSQKNPILKEFIISIIDYVKENKIKSKEEGTALAIYKIQMITGPLAFNDFFQTKINKQSPNELIQIFSPYIFEPGEPFSLFDIRNDTISIHKMEMTWFSDNLKSVVELYYKSKKYIYIIIIIIILFVLYKLNYYEIIIK